MHSAKVQILEGIARVLSILISQNQKPEAMKQYVAFLLLPFFCLACVSEQPQSPSPQPEEQRQEPAPTSTRLEEEFEQGLEQEKQLDSTIKKRERPSLAAPQLVFTYQNYQFDTIAQDSILLHDFVFKNMGEKALEIQSVEASCGCTTASYPFVLIGSGEEGKITVRFDSKGRQGKQKALVRVFSNAEIAEQSLSMQGYVEEKN